MAEKAVGPYNSFSFSSPRSTILAATYMYKGNPTAKAQTCSTVIVTLNPMKL